MNGPPLFVRTGDGYLADPIADGPWAEGSLHGGAPAALLSHLLAAQVPDPALRLARLTCEFVRPAPRGPLTPRVEIVRSGRRVTLLDASLSDAAGVAVTRARALFLRASEIHVGVEEPPPFPGPEAGVGADWDPGRPTFLTEGMEISFVEGRFRAIGPGTAWFRLRGPIVAGEPTLPSDRVAAAADFGNGIATILSWEEHTFINPDLSIFIERDPDDEWVALRSRMRVSEGSVAIAESELWDRRGRLGRAVQTLLVGRLPDTGNSDAGSVTT
jgi:hypothetical protein